MMSLPRLTLNACDEATFAGFCQHTHVLPHAHGHTLPNLVHTSTLAPHPSHAQHTHATLNVCKSTTQVSSAHQTNGLLRLSQHALSNNHSSGPQPSSMYLSELAAGPNGDLRLVKTKAIPDVQVGHWQGLM